MTGRLDMKGWAASCFGAKEAAEAPAGATGSQLDVAAPAVNRLAPVPLDLSPGDGTRPAWGGIKRDPELFLVAEDPHRRFWFDVENRFATFWDEQRELDRQRLAMLDRCYRARG